MTQDPRGRIAWHELMTTDVESAKSFYGNVIGWGTQSWPKDPSYLVWTLGGAQMGGLMPLPEEAKRGGAPPHWLMYVAVENAEAAVMRATSLGGEVLYGPQTVPDAGTFAVLQDPQGAVFAVHQSAAAPGHDGEPRVGEFSWHELATTDREAAWAFYQALFGWDATEQLDMGPMGIYFMFGRYGRSLGGIHGKPPEVPAPHWLHYVRVPDVDRAVEAVRRFGGRVVNGPMEVPGGDRVAQCMDPQGAMFAVHAVAAIAAAREPAAAAVLEPAVRKPAPKKPAARKKAKPAAKQRAAPPKKRAKKKAATRKPPKKKAATRKPPKKKAAKRGPTKKKAVKRAKKAGRKKRR